MNYETHVFPTLYKTNKNGKESSWWIKTNDKGEIMTFSRVNEVRTFPIITVKPKNVGKKNETTLKLQAFMEAQSRWLKKKDQGYFEKGKKAEYKLPMLAKKYEKRLVRFPCGVSPKLDGIRCLAMWRDDQIVLYSRKGKEFPFLIHIKEELKFLPKEWILDGELYTHGLPFSEIASISRKTKTPDIEEVRLNYTVFDVIAPLPYSDRMTKLKEMSETKSISFLLYEIVKDETELFRVAAKHLKDHYEGTMIRNMNGKYAINFRSSDLLKYKEFDDEEFEIIGFAHGKGTEDGAIVFVCKDGEKKFRVRPRGTIEKRREMYSNGESYVGKKLTVRFQGRDEVPRFPVGIEIRDYE